MSTDATEVRRCRHYLPIENCGTCYPGPSILAKPFGCICPAGANKDCESPLCPRKAPKFMSSGMAEGRL